MHANVGMTWMDSHDLDFGPVLDFLCYGWVDGERQKVCGGANRGCEADPHDCRKAAGAEDTKTPLPAIVILYAMPCSLFLEFRGALFSCIFCCGLVSDCFRFACFFFFNRSEPNCPCHLLVL